MKSKMGYIPNLITFKLIFDHSQLQNSKEGLERNNPSCDANFSHMDIPSDLTGIRFLHEYNHPAHAVTLSVGELVWFWKQGLYVVSTLTFILSWFWEISGASINDSYKMAQPGGGCILSKEMVDCRQNITQFNLEVISRTHEQIINNWSYQ